MLAIDAEMEFGWVILGGGYVLTRGFSCRSGRNVEKSLLIITYIVGIAFEQGSCGGQVRQ